MYLCVYSGYLNINDIIGQVTPMQGKSITILADNDMHQDEIKIEMIFALLALRE